MVTDLLREVYKTANPLAKTREPERNRALQAMANRLTQQQDEILEANTLDLESGRELAVSDRILDWLKLTPERLQTAIQMLQNLATLPDPIQRLTATSYQTGYAQTYYQLMPLGVIALVYEAFPDLAIIAAGLCLKSGNCLVLRGSGETSHSNRAIVANLRAALKSSGFPETCLALLPNDQGLSICDLVTQDQWINLVIPYGRTSLVQEVVQQATVPVLRAAIGNCYLYWAPSGSLETVRWMILESHQGTPDAVNAIEKVLIHTNHSRAALKLLCAGLREEGFALYGDADLVAEFPDLPLADPEMWGKASLERRVTFKMVDSLEGAIAWMNDHSSGHADCLATESYQESRLFSVGMNSACIYINASPRFSRIAKPGGSVFLGMSNQKGQRRGPIGLEVLTTVKQIIQGNGQ